MSGGKRPLLSSLISTWVSENALFDQFLKRTVCRLDLQVEVEAQALAAGSHLLDSGDLVFDGLFGVRSFAEIKLHVLSDVVVVRIGD